MSIRLQRCCSAERARRPHWGVPPSQWIHPLASTESNYMSTLSEREGISQEDVRVAIGCRVIDRKNWLATEEAVPRGFADQRQQDEIAGAGKKP